MKLLIGVPTGEYSRRADFYDYLSALEKPSDCFLMSPHGQSPAKNRNIIIEAALTNNCTHVFFLDDDMVFPSDILTRLLKHSHLDVVSALYLMRNYPHYPVLFDEAYDSGLCKFMFLTPNKTGLVKAVNCGFGCVLIKTDVFKKLEKPWVTLGEIEKDGWCDDVSFFNRVRKAGFEIYCDLDVQVGHMLNLTLWPGKKEGGWNTLYKTVTGETIEFPQFTSSAHDALVEKTGE